MFRDLSIKSRLMLGFGSVIVVMALLAATATVQFARTQKLSELIAGKLTEQIGSADSFAISVERGQTSLRSYFQTGESKHQREYAAAVSDQGPALRQLARGMSGSVDHHMLDVLEEQASDLKHAEAHAIGRFQSGDRKGAYRYHQARIHPLVEQITAAASDIALKGHEEVRRITAEMNASRKLAYTLTWSLALIGFLFAISFASVTVRSITRPAKQIAAAAEAISRGDYSSKNVLDGSAERNGRPASRNELLRISAAIARMAGALERRERNLAAHADISSVCASTIELGELVTNSLARLAESTLSQTGAIFVRRDGQLVVAGTYGIPDEAAARALADSNGMVEETVRSGKMMTLEDIPRDTPLVVQSGLGAFLPRSVACIPMIVEDRTRGAIVLGSVYGYDVDALALMEGSSSDIGVAIANALRHLEVRSLAQALQAANEHLDSQNEELQCQNEELQAQGEEIQAQSEEIAAQNEELATQTVELQRRNEELNRLTKDLDDLQSLTAVGLSSLDPIVLSQRLLDAIAGALDVQFGLVMLLDEDGVTLRSKVWHNVPVPRPDVWSVQVGEGFAGRAAETMKMLTIPDAGSEPLFTNPYLAQAGVKALAGIPLALDGRLLGVALLGSSKPRHFNDHEKQLFEVFALRTAVAIDRAQSYEKVSKAEYRYRVERDQLLSIIESIPEAVVIGAAPDGELVIANRAALALLAVEELPDAKIGQYPEAYHVFGPNGEVMPGEDLPLSRSILKGEVCTNVELVLRHPDGKDVPIVVNSAPVRDEEGNIVSGVAVFQDASKAVERQRMLQEGLEYQRFIAHELQQAFLPTARPEMPGYDVADIYAPATMDTEVGGDFYDIIDLGNGEIGVVMADVSGKGVKAAVYAAMAKYMLHAFAHEEPQPAKVLRRLNDALVRYVKREVFVTLFYGVIDTAENRLVYANAGHEEPLVRRTSGGGVLALSGSGPALGVIKGAGYEQMETLLQPGDALILYTDGITEARSGADTMGRERLEEVIRGGDCRDAGELVRHILAAAHEFDGGNQRDDIALLVLKPAESG